MALTKDFSYVDYSASFTNVPARNRILTNLGIFQRDTTDQFKTSVDFLNAQADTIAPAAERFSNSQWGSTPKPKAANHLIELPLFPTQDIITAADVQPFRKYGSPLQASVLDAVTAKGLAHHERFAATRERMFAESLFAIVSPIWNTPLMARSWIGQRNLAMTRAPEPSTRVLLLIR